MTTWGGESLYDSDFKDYIIYLGLFKGVAINKKVLERAAVQLFRLAHLGKSLFITCDYHIKQAQKCFYVAE